MSGDPNLEPFSLISTFITSPLKRGFSVARAAGYTMEETPTVPVSSIVIGGALKV